MSYEGGSYPQGIPSSSAIIRNARTKIYELLDQISRCPDSESSLNAWRELCAFGYATVMDAYDRGYFPTTDTKTDWASVVSKIEKIWDGLRTSEKTEFKTIREGNFLTMSIQWDTVVGEVPPELFMQGIKVMDKEKYDAIAHRMAQLWGYQEFALYACGILEINKDIEIIEPLDLYTEKQSRSAIESRKGVPRPTESTQQQRK